MFLLVFFFLPALYPVAPVPSAKPAAACRCSLRAEADVEPKLPSAKMAPAGAARHRPAVRRSGPGREARRRAGPRGAGRPLQEMKTERDWWGSGAGVWGGRSREGQRVPVGEEGKQEVLARVAGVRRFHLIKRHLTTIFF